MKKVKFIAMGMVDQEIFGMLQDNQSKALTPSGWWRVNDINLAARRAVICAELHPNDCEIELVDLRSK